MKHYITKFLVLEKYSEIKFLVVLFISIQVIKKS